MRALLFRSVVLGGMVLGVFGCGAILGIPDDVAPEPLTPGLPESGPDVVVPVDAAPDAEPEAGPDAGPDAEPPPLCDLTKDFLTPVPIASLNTVEQDGAARLSEDELTIYLDGVRSATAASFDIFYAERTSLAAPFGPVKRFPSVDNSIDTADDEYAPNVSDNGLVLIFERKNLATNNSDIYTATRTSKADPFGPVSTVSNLNTADFEANVFIRGDTKELWHVRKDQMVDIFLATLTPGTGYVISKPANVNSAFNDASPVISRNGLALYFRSSRPIAAGRTDNNIWVTTRTSTTSPFNPPVAVANVNSTMNDYPGWISKDGCRLYLVSDRPGVGQQDVYVATRPM